MSASPSCFHHGDAYDQLVEIICPDWSKWPSSTSAVLEVAILPSSSHPNIQYDPKTSPPAVGIPKSLGLACFLRARAIFFSSTRAVSENKEFDSERDRLLGATAVMLVWEPNHLTAINWRRRAMQQLLPSVSPSKQRELGQRARRAECMFLESLLTSPMSQHAKSSMLWAYRLQLLQASNDGCGKYMFGDSPREGLSVQRAWRMELNIVMRAGERHPKNYYAWEYCRRVSRLLLDCRSSEERDLQQVESLRDIDFVGDSLAVILQWCLRHPTDVSGWAFLASWLQEIPDRAMAMQEGIEILTKTRDFLKYFGWKGESVTWFLRTMDAMGFQAKYET